MRKILQLAIDISDPDPEKNNHILTIGPVQVDIIIEGNTLEEVHAKTEALRHKYQKGVSIYFPKYIDQLEQSEKPKP